MSEISTRYLFHWALLILFREAIIFWVIISKAEKSGFKLFWGFVFFKQCSKYQMSDVLEMVESW